MKNRHPLVTNVLIGGVVMLGVVILLYFFSKHISYLKI